MRRRLKLALIIGVGLLVLAVAVLWALPEIVRRVALDQIAKRTGRAATIGDVDLNLFTGRLAIKQFRLADRPGPEPFVEFERFEVRLAPLALLRSHVLVRELALVAPTVRVVRTGPAEFNFSDLVAGTGEPAPEPAPAPSRWTVTVERLSLSRGRITVDDRAVTPPAEWLVQDLDVDVKSLTTAAGAAPGAAQHPGEDQRGRSRRGRRPDAAGAAPVPRHAVARRLRDAAAHPVRVRAPRHPVPAAGGPTLDRSRQHLGQRRAGDPEGGALRHPDPGRRGLRQGRPPGSVRVRLAAGRGDRGSRRARAHADDPASDHRWPRPEGPARRPGCHRPDRAVHPEGRRRPPPRPARPRRPGRLPRRPRASGGPCSR